MTGSKAAQVSTSKLAFHRRPVHAEGFARRITYFGGSLKRSVLAGTAETRRTAAAILIANPRLETRLSRRKQKTAATSNSEFLHYFMSHCYPFATNSNLPLVAALLIGIVCRLEIELTSCKQRAELDSNRLKNADYNIRLSLIIQPASQGAALA